MTMRQTTRLPGRSQRGAVLIVALVLLLVLTILGTASVRDTAMEERMAGNFRDYSAALEAAETALRTGEIALGSSTAFSNMTFASSGNSGLYDVALLSSSIDPYEDEKYGLEVGDTVLKEGGQTGNQLLVTELPEYYIEQLPEIDLPGSDLVVGFQDKPPPVQFYRVTGKGYGISPNSEVILQSTYFR
jgi:type IV pilus assembly protein PilX